MTQRRVPAGKLFVLRHPRRRHSSVDRSPSSSCSSNSKHSRRHHHLRRRRYRCRRCSTSRLSTSQLLQPGLGRPEERPAPLGHPASHDFAETTRRAAGSGVSPSAERAEGQAANDNTDSTIWQGRPKRGQRREKDVQPLPTPRGPWEFSTLQIPGRCRRSCFT